jgi:RNA polymerase sigma-70 factor (ECF subfamily)
MNVSGQPHSERIEGQARFRTTHWTVVLDAAQSSAERSYEGFGRIYLDYWYPLYAHIRRRGYSPAEAEDIAQDFFLHLIEQQSLEGLRRQGGRFRTFLLRLLENFLVNQWDRARAQKRGGGAPHLALISAEDEARFALEAPATDDPEHAFEQQ